jgi:hypothetical protein
MNRSSVNELIGAVAIVIALGLYIALILRPAWTSYQRGWERVTATVLSLYVFVLLVGIGAAIALAAVYYWG